MHFQYLSILSLKLFVFDLLFLHFYKSGIDYRYEKMQVAKIHRVNLLEINLSFNYLVKLT